MRLPRLALRIYLSGLAQMATVAVGFFLLLGLRRASDMAREREARAAVDTVVAELGEQEALKRELVRLERALDATIIVYDETGYVIASSGPVEALPPAPPMGPPPYPPFVPGSPFAAPSPTQDASPPPPGPPPDLPPDDRDPFRHHGPHPEPGMFPGPHGPPFPAFVFPIRLPSGGPGRVVIASHSDRHPPPDGLAITGIVLVVVAIASALTARSLAKPLARLSAAARAFGEGQRGVRVGITRHDEIGEVAAAFDDMASRVEGLLKAERELLANVSHELRTPLARIRVALELAASGDAATVSDSVGEITRDLAELDRLIGDVLVAARLDLAADPASAAIPPLRRQQVDLDDVIGQAVSRFRSAHPERALVLSVAPVLPTLSGDPVLLRRAIDNLLDNAHKYGDGGVVELSAETIEGGARVEIRDHGIGIAEGDMAHVFRPFFRADRSRTRSTGGLGLGLALSRRIVEAHDGTLTLQSKLGEGTCARIELRVRP